MKMKIKIILTMLILLFSINNVVAIVDEYSTSYQKSNSVTIPGSNTETSSICCVYVKDVVVMKDLSFAQVKMTQWIGSTENSDYASCKFYKDIAKTQQIGTGVVGFIKGYDDLYRVQIFINEPLDWGVTGAQHIYWSLNFGQSLGSMGCYLGTGAPTLTSNQIAFGGVHAGNPWYMKQDSIHTAQYLYSFTNEFEYIYNSDNERFEYTIYRNSSYPSKLHIDNTNITLRNETSIYTTNWSTYNYDTEYTTWNTHIETSEGDIIYKVLDWSLLMEDEEVEDEDACRIEADNIEIGDTINVSYFNIDDLRTNPISYGNSDYADCDINIQVIADRGYYEELIYQDLITDESDNTFYYSSGTLTAGIYYTQINKNLGGLNDYAVRTSFIISHPANYSIIVNPDSVYVGDNINIIYKSLNQSTLNVYDNDDELIKSYINIQGEDQKVYQIPPDYAYENTYPSWYVYLNDSGNASNNLRFNFTVNWKLYTEPEPTPEPTEPYYDEDIEGNIDQIKEGLDPIKQLIFGLSTIFVDNPDYNNDGIVDVNEVSSWLNSLIGIAIIIFIYILYTVYKRRES